MTAKKTVKANGDKQFWVRLGVDFGKTSQLAEDTSKHLTHFIENDFLHLSKKVDDILDRVQRNTTRHAVIAAIATFLIITATILSRVL